MLEQNNGTNNAMNAEADEIMSTISIRERAGNDLLLLGIVEGIPGFCPLEEFIHAVAMLFIRVDKGLLNTDQSQDCPLGQLPAMRACSVIAWVSLCIMKADG
jgi:hypothetical protein